MQRIDLAVPRQRLGGCDVEQIAIVHHPLIVEQNNRGFRIVTSPRFYIFCNK